MEKELLGDKMRASENIIFEDRRTTDRIEIICYSAIGARESQQDAAFAYVDDERALALICDGMGGVRGGEAASRTTVDYVRERFYEELDGTADFVENGLQTLEAVDDVVYQLRDSAGKRLGCGTTLAAAYLNCGWLYWFSVGDSRIYLMRGQQMVQATTDHNYHLLLLNQLQAGEISDAEYQKEAPRGEALISFIGMGGLMLIDVNDKGLPLLTGDTVLVCSDGIYRTISDAELCTLLQLSSLEGSAQRMIEMIEERMSMRQDNFTFVLMRKRK